VQLSAQQLIIVDDASHSDDGTETIWTTDPRLTLRRIDKLKFASNSTETGHQLHIRFASSVDPEVALLRGSSSPFAGWVVSSGVPQPSDALRVTHPNGNAATATLIEIAESSDMLSVQSFTRKDSEDWRIGLTDSHGDVIIERKAWSVSVTKSSNTFSIHVNEAPDIGERQSALRAAINDAINRYPPWRDLSAYHFRLYVMISLLWLVIEVAILVVPNSITRRTWLQLAPLGAWIGLAFWIHYRYLI
jgi:hypothetical protein